MTYRELNELFSRTWADEKGLIRGNPVGLIYKINQLADTLDSTVDEETLRTELKRAELSLDFC